MGKIENNMKQVKYNLFINWYFDKNPIRNAEYERCLNENLSNDNIERVIVLTEEFEYLHQMLFQKFEYNPKLYAILKNRRPTFNDFFRVMSTYENTILANSDIIIKETPQVPLNICWALTRWDEDISGDTLIFERHDSQDSWWFQKCPSYLHGADFSLGIPGCDNIIAGLLYDSGIQVFNPSRTIKTTHIHSSNVRNYIPSSDRLYGAYRNIPLTELIS
jgi:hypothetical protein